MPITTFICEARKKEETLDTFKMVLDINKEFENMDQVNFVSRKIRNKINLIKAFEKKGKKKKNNSKTKKKTENYCDSILIVTWIYEDPPTKLEKLKKYINIF